MKRIKNVSTVVYDPKQEPVILTKPLSDTFLKEEKPAELMALYWFYYYTAKWQLTNKPRVTTKYVANGLKISPEQVRRSKKRLIELGLIQDVKNRDGKGKIVGHYIQVNLIQPGTILRENHSMGNQQGATLRKSHSMANPETNALIYNNEILKPKKQTSPAGSVREISSSPTNSKDKKRKSSEDAIWLTKRFAALYLNPIYDMSLVGDRWHAAVKMFDKLLKSVRHDKARIARAIDWLIKNHGLEYVPQVTSVNDLVYKFNAVEEAMRRNGDASVTPRERRDIPKTPEELVAEAMEPDTLREMWLEDCVFPAIKLIGNGDSEKITRNILDIKEWYSEKQKCDTYGVIPIAYGAVKQYVEWLKRQDWFDSVKPSHFEPQSKVFQRYLNEHQREIGFNLFTGKELY